MVKLGTILFSLGVVFFVLIGLDYVHVLGSIAENKRLKGENFKLRQEMQLIRNKVESMESTMERVRNYAKKLQILTGQPGEREITGLPQGGSGDSENSWLREPKSIEPATTPSEKRSQKDDPEKDGFGYLYNENYLAARVEKLQNSGMLTELNLSQLQGYLFARTAIVTATPSLMPINGWLSSPFGYRRHPYDGTFRLHAGVDIAAEAGAPVRAPAPGLVVFSGYKEGYGKVIVVNHGYGISTVFGHMSKLFLNQGTRIKRGETIGEVGSTGHATGPHLHYEIRKNGIPVNPVTFLSRNRF
jgi:murein DD-endopeptidase MepM/ murein hydrolase activator NlpD